MQNTVQNCYKIKTDDTYLEQIPHGSQAYPFAFYLEDIWKYDRHCVNWHWHPEIEYMYMKEGSVVCYVGAQKIILNEGEGMFINGSVLHRFEAGSKTLVPNIVFHPAMLGGKDSVIYQKYVQPVLQTNTTCRVYRPCTEWEEKLLSIGCQIFELNQKNLEEGENQTYAELETSMLLHQMWKLIHSHWDFTKADDNYVRKNRYASKLHIMIRYIQEHYAEPITLADIASEISVSKNTVLNLFKKEMNTSPIVYLGEYRLEQAVEKLISTEKKLTIIAQECGFSDTGYFCKRFKQQYGMTAAEYRERKRSL